MTVLSSLLPYADLGGKALRIVVVVRESGSAKRFQANGVLFRACYAAEAADR